MADLNVSGLRKRSPEIDLVDNGLTHMCLEILLTSVVWIHHTFQNNLRVRHKFIKYLEESCRMGPEKHLSIKYFQKILSSQLFLPK